MTTAAGWGTRVRGVITAGHAAPSAAVTVMATLLALRAGLAAERVVLVMLAVGTGQFSIGFVNDWWDADHDRAARRAGKPIVAGVVSRTTVGYAAIVSTVLCLAASSWLGRAGAVNLVIVAAGWTYDLRAKTTPFSIVPYLVAFGLLPAVATLASTPAGWPPVWMVAAGALLGGGGHFANALPDLESDAAVGVRGLPQRLGPRRSVLAAAVCLGAGAAIALGGAGGGLAVMGGGLITLALLIAVVVTAGRGHQRLAFRLTMGLALIVVATLLVPT